MKRSVILTVSVLLWAACGKPEDKKIAPPFDCAAFSLGISQNSDSLAGPEVDKICAGLMPVPPTAEDAYGQHDNLWVLAEKLSRCGIKATVNCYACIETLPAQSEIVVELEQDGVTCRKVIDLITTPDLMLAYNGMHD